MPIVFPENETVKALVPITPILAEVVQTVEAKMPDATGPEKLETVLAFAVVLLNALGTLSPVLPIVSAVISGLVSVFNVAGIFKKKTATKSTG